jgi:hypothetical protein
MEASMFKLQGMCEFMLPKKAMEEELAAIA